ncbi:MAG: MGH1-like glycoside hydrolase domain-containing protein [Chloroflexota bacterium]
MDPLEELRRKDKWYLGGGRSLIWAPPFPSFLDWPGFWDEAHYFDYPVERPFTVALLDEDHRAIGLKPLSRDWRPSELTTAWMAGDLLVSERKCVLPDNVLAAELTIWNPTSVDRRLDAVAYTLQRSVPSQGDDVTADATFDGRAFHLTRRRVLRLHGRELPAFTYGMALGGDRPADSFGGQLSEWNSYRPDWELTPFADAMPSGSLGNDLRLGGRDPDGVVYLGLHYRVEVPAESRARLVIGCAIGGDLGQLLLQPIEVSQRAWADYFGSLPSLAVDDEHQQRCWWYRWYGLRLNTVSAPSAFSAHPFVAEGVAQFRAAISYSAQCHVLETRWMPNPDLARGSLLNFVDRQSSNGSLPASIYAGLVNDDHIYHANWGLAIRELHAVHPDADFLRTVYQPLVRYARFLDDERDPEGCHLYDVINQAETGQEYMSRYQAVDAAADRWGPFRLKGVDATVYAYELQRALAWMATDLGHASDAVYWTAQANATRQAVVDRMWDGGLEFFCDVNPETGQRTGVKAATGFYPFMTDIARVEHLAALRSHLLDPGQFWTPFPVPSTSVDDPYFSPAGLWKGKRQSCPWNGRAWPMATSHVCRALARAGQALDRSLQGSAADLIQRFVRTLFHDGDAARPNSYEHYNPFTGQPSAYRGIDDYQHAAVLDLLVRYLVGLQPEVDGTVTVDPLPFDLPSFALDNVLVRSHALSISWHTARGFRVLADGREIHHSAARQPVTFRL